jgi:hypothetical protein
VAENATGVAAIGGYAKIERIGYGLNTKPQGHDSLGYQWVLGNNVFSLPRFVLNHHNEGWQGEQWSLHMLVN